MTFPPCLQLQCSPSRSCPAPDACARGHGYRLSQTISSGRRMPVNGHFGWHRLCPLPFPPLRGSCLGCPYFPCLPKVSPCLSTAPGTRPPWEWPQVSLRCFTRSPAVLCDSYQSHHLSASKLSSGATSSPAGRPEPFLAKWLNWKYSSPVGAKQRRLSPAASRAVGVAQADLNPGFLCS